LPESRPRDADLSGCGTAVVSLEDFYPVEEADLEPTADGFLEAEKCAHLP
jgi:hypothetical protein